MTPATSIRLLPLLTILLLHLLALAAGLLAVPVPALATRGFDTPTLAILLTTHVLAVSLLGGWLLATGATAIAAAASLLPFAAIAAFDGAVPWPAAAAATGLAITWTAALATLARGWPSLDRAGGLAVTATLLAAGLPVLRYLAIDAQAASGAERGWTLLSPTLAALSLQRGGGSMAGFALPLALLAAGLVAVATRRGRDRSLRDPGDAGTP